MVPSPPAPETCSSSRGVETARVVAHRCIADVTWRIRLECPSLASRAQAGHFAMVRIDGRVDPLLGRPLAVYDTYRDAGATAPEGPPAARRYVDFVYTVHGRFTTALATLDTGAEVTVLGPLGNGWRDVPTVDHLLLVGGGIGQTSLLTLGRDRVAAGARVTFCWGARRAASFGDVEDFERAGIEVHLATLDGSRGHRGNVIDLLDGAVPSSTPPGHIACCGPDPMMAAVARWAGSASPAWRRSATGAAAGTGGGRASRGRSSPPRRSSGTEPAPVTGPAVSRPPSTP